MSSSDPIRVLVVDDSAFARKVVREVLTRDPAIEVVGIARDGLEAVEKISELAPDVVTLDLLMPDLDGVGVLRALPKKNPPRVVIVSVSNSDADVAVEALQAGAVDLVTKPTPLPTDRLYGMESELVSKVKAAAAARPHPLGLEPESARPALRVLSAPPAARLVVVGTSTGGPQALTQLFKQLPKGLPVPIAIALHIPAGYTAPLAARLTNLGGIKVTEASQGMQLVPGEAVIAPGGMHLKIKESGGKFYAEVTREPVDKVHFPSVDVLFESAAEAAGGGVVGVVLTGMGDDGMRGSAAIREAGGRVLAEAAKSCVVYGMPRSVIEAGYASGEAPLDEVPTLITNWIYERSVQGSA